MLSWDKDWMLPTIPTQTIPAQDASLWGTEISVENRHDLWTAIFQILSQTMILVGLSLLIVIKNTSCPVFLADSAERCARQPNSSKLVMHFSNSLVDLQPQTIANKIVTLCPKAMQEMDEYMMRNHRDSSNTHLTSGLMAILRAIANPQMPRAAPMAANNGNICFPQASKPI